MTNRQRLGTRAVTASRGRWDGRGRKSRWSSLSRLALAAVFAAQIGCSHNPAPDDDDQPPPPSDPIPVHVKNENFLDVNVAAVVSGVSHRLGTVTGNGSADFKVTWSAANGQQLQLTATPIGGRGAYTSAGSDRQHGAGDRVQDWVGVPPERRRRARADVAFAWR